MNMCLWILFDVWPCGSADQQGYVSITLLLFSHLKTRHLLGDVERARCPMLGVLHHAVFERGSPWTGSLDVGGRNGTETTVGPEKGREVIGMA